MNLTEGQLFTIEALNRIEGFSWPDNAKFADFGSGGSFVFFRLHEPKALRGSFDGGYIDGSLVDTGVVHPDWRNSLITREQFDSVDGWVRNDGNEPVSGVSGYCRVDVKHENGIIDLGFSSDGYEWDWQGDNEYRIVAWRYHKPTKETEMKDTEAFQPPIHETYYRYKKQRETTADARKALEASMETEDKLLDQIKAWNLEYGFDIRALDESDEVPDVEPELVITDWRDLRVGDEIWWSGGAGFSSGQYIISEVSKKGVSVTTWKGQSWLDVLNTAWKFIRRP